MVFSSSRIRNGSIAPSHSKHSGLFPSSLCQLYEFVGDGAERVQVSRNTALRQSFLSTTARPHRAIVFGEVGWLSPFFLSFIAYLIPSPDRNFFPQIIFSEFRLPSTLGPTECGDTDILMVINFHLHILPSGLRFPHSNEHCLEHTLQSVSRDAGRWVQSISFNFKRRDTSAQQQGNV